MAHIYLFRHGQSEHNVNKVFSGWSDPPLTALGIEHAQNLGLMLKDKRIDIAYTTDLSRAQDTLKAVLEYHPECKETIIDVRMKERRYGDFQGIPHADIIAKYGQEAYDKWHRGWSDRTPNGESFADVEIRVQGFIDMLKQKYSNQDINIAISAHGNSIRLFRKIMENATIEDTCSWTIPYDQIFEYEI